MKTHTFAPPGTDLSPRLERNYRGRDLVVGDIHGHFATLRRALAELEVGEYDRVFSLGDLVDRGPDSWAAKDWIAGSDPSARLHLVLRGNHEQMMLAALVEGPRRRLQRWTNDAWSLWMMNGGDWWRATIREQSANAWIEALSALTVLRAGGDGVRAGRAGACRPRARAMAGPRGVGERRRRSESPDAHPGPLEPGPTRPRAAGDWRDRGNEHMGPVEGVRCVITGHTPVR